MVTSRIVSPEAVSALTPVFSCRSTGRSAVWAVGSAAAAASWSGDTGHGAPIKNHVLGLASTQSAAANPVHHTILDVEILAHFLELFVGSRGAYCRLGLICSS